MVREVLLEGISRDPIVSKPRLRSSAYFKGKTTLTQEGDIFVRARGRKQNWRDPSIGKLIDGQVTLFCEATLDR